MTSQETTPKEVSVYAIYNSIKQYQALMAEINSGDTRENFSNKKSLKPPDFIDSLQFVRYTILDPLGRKLTAEEILILARMNANDELYEQNRDFDDG